MFEKFTELAIDTVYDAQNCAIKLGSSEVYIEHLFYAIVNNAKGISLRLFRNSGITAEKAEEDIKNYISPTNKSYVVVPFTKEFKTLLKLALDIANKSGQNNILYEHLFLALLNIKNPIFSLSEKMTPFQKMFLSHNGLRMRKICRQWRMPNTIAGWHLKEAMDGDLPTSSRRKPSFTNTKEAGPMILNSDCIRLWLKTKI